MRFGLFQQHRRKFTRDLDWCQQIDGQQPVPLGRRHLVRGTIKGDPRIVDENINGIPLFPQRTDCSRNFVRVGQINLLPRRINTQRTNFGNDSGQTGLIDISNKDIGPFTSQRHCNSTPNSRRGTSDQCPFSTNLFQTKFPQQQDSVGTIRY